MSKKKQKEQRWYKMDLHLHTPGSADYQQPNISYLDILQYAESKELDIIAFTDHNTVRGYAAMLQEIEQLEYLESLDRATEDERFALQEYKRLREKLLILPGFEFTATFGFHILCIFPADTTVRQLEHTLLKLNVPSDAIEHGLPHVGASSDVLNCYRVVNAAGGMVIAAHVNSTNGIANRSITFDEQLRMAYAQDRNLHALEVTDLEKPGRRTTASFFDGTKRGYPRRMHCIQGSDAHRMTASDPKSKLLGIGDRCTEILLPEASFEAIMQVFQGNDFDLVRPHRLYSKNIDLVKVARQEGANERQAFYPDVDRRNGNLVSIVQDICAFANTEGGTVYIGMTGDPKDRIDGVKDAHQDSIALYEEVEKQISPSLDIQIETQLVYKQNVLFVRVPNGEQIPYAVENQRIYIRDGRLTKLASRDEIVQLIIEHSDGEITPLLFDQMTGVIQP